MQHGPLWIWVVHHINLRSGVDVPADVRSEDGSALGGESCANVSVQWAVTVLGRMTYTTADTANLVGLRVGQADDIHDLDHDILILSLDVDKVEQDWAFHRLPIDELEVDVLGPSRINAIAIVPDWANECLILVHNEAVTGSSSLGRHERLLC